MAVHLEPAVLKAILSSIDEGIHVVDRNGITIFYNHAAARFDGLEIEEVEGKYLLQVFPSLTSESSTLLKVIETGTPIYNQHQTYTNVKGKKIDTVNTTLPIYIDGQLYGALEIAKDLTKVKELSEKLVDLQVQLIKPNLNRMKGRGKGARYEVTDILSADKRMKMIKHQILKVARTSSPVFVYGETGTGKELVVQSIHNASPRRNKPFVAQNCAALPAALLESILFGTVKGSYTGAENRMGLFELADGGTLFLDEINSMPVHLQAKLLRALQDGTIRRIGGSDNFPVDVRVIAAMNTSPQLALKDGTLRSDLYYRLHVVSIAIPPLRERRGDIPLLTEAFIDKFNQQFASSVKGVSKEVMDWMMTYDWPGNVRELEHLLEGAMNVVEGEWIDTEHIPNHFIERGVSSASDRPHLIHGRTSREWEMNEIPPLREALDQLEQQLINRAMKATEGNVKRAAEILQIPRQTLQYKLKK
ncbi:sigma-54 interaction domain-containing protein [Microaerobacter geothermalis]|uniref:sigma-54 interaction domain-containing protein n=1 Tax=Microaerobacter geothermalis TaxID=674972 RepID=UPI0022A76423|nr:sigma 54-interacting transcriptional regulator [Microaerobacter geothermalis]